MRMDLRDMKVRAWCEPGQWGRRLTMKGEMARLMIGMEVGQSVSIESATDMRGMDIKLQNLRIYAYQKFPGKLFSTSLLKGGPLTIVRIA